jgi:phosphatidate cytidylyltransferase
MHKRTPPHRYPGAVSQANASGNQAGPGNGRVPHRTGAIARPAPGAATHEFLVRGAHGQGAAAGMPESSGEPTTPAASRRGRTTPEWLAGLGQRSATAFILMPVVIAIVWFGGWVAFGCTVVVAALGLWELRSMLAQRGWHPILPLSAALGLCFLVAAMLPQQREAIAGLGISATIVVAFLWLMLARNEALEGSLTDWALTLVLPLYLAWPLALFLLLRGNTAGYHTAGFWWSLTTLFTVWAFDTFAFFAGRFFGRHRLAPRISPKKTWEGAAGGLIFAIVAAVLFTRPIGVPWYHALAIGVLVSFAATVGDLAESLLKRDTGVKDSGTLMRGHGGVLDRIDSLLFAVMAVFFYAVFLGSIRV